ncbi:ABC transporter substrate-binding protein [Spongisporangium articulatum]|uniref:ABC transporter substrate-binding protein n=1 Tax=Spongisporangium articulatum TaxID=3362603 RepID=A0ABW8AKC1_9ACTN
MRRTTSRTTTAWLALGTAATLVVAGCSAGSGVNTGGGSGTGAGTLNAAIAGEPDQLDPHKTTSYMSFEVLENVYDTLVEPDENLEMQPALAESWTTSPDKLKWTFKLRKDVTFHNGDAFTADDVVYSYDRIIDDKLQTAYKFDSVKDVKKVDDYTVDIDLKTETPNLLANLGSFKGMAIVDKANVEDKKIGSAPVGTGPFSFESWQRGQSISLKANPKYWGGAPKLGGVKFTFVKEPSTALANLRGGQVQWTDNLPPAQVTALTKSSNPVVKSVPSNDYWYFALNEKKKPFNDVRVRQAFAWGIDRNAITEAAKYGAAQPNQTAIPKTSSWYYDYAPYSYDPAKAKALLDQAGVKNLSVDFMVTSEYPESVTIAQVMKDQLSKAGIDLKIRTEDFNTWLADEGSGKYDGFALSWLGNIDPDEFYYSQHHTGGSYNFQKFSNKDVDAALDKGHTTSDQAARKAAYDQAAKLIVDQASYIYLYNPNVVQGYSSKLQGYTVRGDRAVRFRDASLSS